MNIRTLIIVGLVSLIPLWAVPFYLSHDGIANIARFAAYFGAFADGSLIPRWAGDLNYGYGSPVLSFYYPLPGYIASLLHSLGFSYVLSYKLIISAAFILCGLSFYLWISTLFRKDTAFLGALLYMLLPYHFLDLYVRGDIGELVALSVLPFVFYFIERQKKKDTPIQRLAIASSFGILILSHNGISLMATPLIILYCLLFTSNHKLRLKLLLWLGVGLMLSAFFWFPALFEQKYVNGKLFIGSMYQEHFPRLASFFYSAWGFGADVNKSGGLSPQLGIMQILVTVLGVLWLTIKKHLSKEIYFWVASFVVYLFIASFLSDFLWNNISLLKVYEFPWRFIALASFSLCVLASFVLQKIVNKKILLSLGIVLLFSSLVYMRIQPTTALNDNYFDNFSGTTYFHGEASPIWSAGDASQNPKSPVQIIAGRGEITSYKRLNQKHEYDVLARENITVKDNTFYYPGWKVFSNGRDIPVEFQDQNNRGLITYSLPKGEHTIIVSFGETKLRLLADLLSASSILGLLIYFLIQRKNDVHKT